MRASLHLDTTPTSSTSGFRALEMASKATPRTSWVPYLAAETKMTLYEVCKSNAREARLMLSTQEDRKIIFVAHSLGGLVVQNALRLSRASAETHIRQIETCTAAIMFLGTPHFGSEMAEWASIATGLAQLIGSPNTKIVSALKPDSEMLAEVQNGFHNLLRLRKEEQDELKIICFYEELPIPVSGEVCLHAPWSKEAGSL